ncbi:MAG: HDIG domain-containing metalloprotein [candidate division WOR-3 bacterium]
MEREKALEILKSKLKNERIIKHLFAVESCMRALSQKFGGDEERWALAGLFHDIDYEETKNDPSLHGIKGAEFLEKYGISKDILYAIKAHAGNAQPRRKMDIALLSSDAASGLIVASALVNKGGLRELDTSFVLKRFKEKRFAEGADRKLIERCQDLGLTLEEFISICLLGMKEIANVLDI